MVERTVNVLKSIFTGPVNVDSSGITYKLSEVELNIFTRLNFFHVQYELPMLITVFVVKAVTGAEISIKGMKELKDDKENYFAIVKKAGF